MPPLVQPSPLIRYQFFDANGDPLAFGWVYTFEAGTNTPLATYSDHTAGTANSNPIHLDAGGFADIWLTADSYKIAVQDSTHVPLYTIDGIPGLGSIISVGDLSPLFTTSLAGGALNFAFDSVAAYQLFGRFAGSSGNPSYGAVGSDKQVTHNETGTMRGSDNLLFDDTNRQLKLRDAGADAVVLGIVPASGEPFITFGTSAQFPRIKSDVNTWSFAGHTARDLTFGPSNDPLSTVIGGDGTVTHGTVRTGIGATAGILYLNNANNGAGVFAGAKIICGSIATPETFISAETGSLFITTNGGAGATLWVKESSPTATTGWQAK